jgi:hypothetical protein
MKIKMKAKLLFYVPLSLCLLVGETHAQTTVFQHYGAVDPTTEGFSLLSGGSPSIMPIVDDLGSDAWSIRVGSQEFADYSINLTAQQQAEAAAFGWVLSMNLRIVEPLGASNFGFGIFGSLVTGSESYTVRFAAQTNGDPIVLLGNTQYTLDGVGAGYHDYQFRHDSIEGVTSFWVNDTYLTSVTGAFSANEGQFRWGGGQHPGGIWHAHWNEVSFTIVPEPSSWALFAGGLCVACVAVRRLRKRRSKARE